MPARQQGRDRIIAAMEAEGLPCTGGVCPEIYLEPAYQDRGFDTHARLPTARALDAGALAFAVHPAIPEQLMLNMAARIRHILAWIS